MKGWKTWTGFAFMIISAVLRALGHDQFAQVAETVGGSALAVGIAHKIEKNGL